jgi:hypothetical protein
MWSGRFPTWLTAASKAVGAVQRRDALLQADESHHVSPLQEHSLDRAFDLERFDMSLVASSLLGSRLRSAKAFSESSSSCSRWVARSLGVGGLSQTRYFGPIDPVGWRRSDALHDSRVRRPLTAQSHTRPRLCSHTSAQGKASRAFLSWESANHCEEERVEGRLVSGAVGRCRIPAALEQVRH